MKKAPKKFIITKKEEMHAGRVREKISQGHKSPSISRKIPEYHHTFSWVNLATFRVHGEVVFISFVCGIFIMAIVVTGLQLQKSLEELGKMEALRQELEGRQLYWREIVAKYPDYKDAYFQLAAVSYQLGETTETRRALGKMLEIDPNDVTGQEFIKKIRG